MINSKKNIFILLFGFINISAQTISNDKEAYDYCAANKNTLIAIVWPIAQGKEKKIENLLNSYGTIKYKKKTYLKPKEAFFLLKMAHSNIYIPDMSEHVRWYFPKGTFKKQARIFVWEFKGTMKAALDCKYAIRDLFDLQYRSIHINDNHYETIELAKFFFK